MTVSPWRWIPTLYFTQGIPNVVVVTLSVVMFKMLGLGNAEVAFFTSWLYLPWVIKPLWSPLVDLLGTKRRWIVVLQFVIGAALAMVVLALPAPQAVQWALAVFWLMAFASATHDIAADGFYMLALPERTQAAFVGVRSTFFRLAMITGQGGLVVLAGWLNERTGSVVVAWQGVMGALAVGFVLLALWHAVALPRPQADRPARLPSGGPGALAREFFAVFAAFLRQPGIGRVLAFLLLYRFAEAQLLRLTTPFLLDPVAEGGLGLKAQDVGVVYGMAGVAALTVGGLLGGWVIAQVGLKRALWPLVLALNVPNAVYIALALAQPSSLWVLSSAVVVEQFGYGLGFTAYMVYMLMVASGPDGANPHKTAHYALCTGFMALGMMLPGLWAGWLQEQLGYVNYFIWVCVATVPSFVVAGLIRIDPAFGRRQAPAEAAETAPR